MDQITVAAVSCKNLIGQADESISNMQNWCRLAADRGADLVLFPELNVSGYTPSGIVTNIAESIPGRSTEKIIQLASEFKIIIAFGIIENQDTKYFCSHVLVDANGVIGIQRKIHVPVHEQPYWDFGDKINVFQLPQAKVGIAICRDAFFGEMTRTLYMRGAEIVLMPFGYYNVPRNKYLKETIHGMSIVKACWENGYYAIVCNSAGNRLPSEWEPKGRRFPGWAGVISPWGTVIEFTEEPGNSERMVVSILEPEELIDRREHPNFLAQELRPDLYSL